jgi:hypothetical protein
MRSSVATVDHGRRDVSSRRDVERDALRGVNRCSLVQRAWVG